MKFNIRDDEEERDRDPNLAELGAIVQDQIGHLQNGARVTQHVIQQNGTPYTISVVEGNLDDYDIDVVKNAKPRVGIDLPYGGELCGDLDEEPESVDPRDLEPELGEDPGEHDTEYDVQRILNTGFDDLTDLSEEEANKCTCGLIGPWQRVRAKHLTTCALEGETQF